MTKGQIVSIIKELIEAAKPFLSGDVVDETSGTILLIERLEQAIETGECWLEEVKFGHFDL